jgi:hypothetical protein
MHGERAGIANGYGISGELRGGERYRGMVFAGAATVQTSLHRHHARLVTLGRRT